MECEYCKKILKNSITLKNHQKTKGCLKTRGIDNSTLLSFKCENCHKDFSAKRRFNEHINSCFGDVTKINDKFGDLNSKINNLEYDNKKLRDEIYKLKDVIYDLKIKTYIDENEIKNLNKNMDIFHEDHKVLIDIAKQPKKVINANTQINKMLTVMTPLDFKNVEEMKQIIDEKYDINYIFEGQKGFVQFVHQNLLKDENDNLKYICSDPSRQIFKYKTPDGNVHKDIEAKALINFLISSGLKDKACELTIEWMKDDKGDIDPRKYQIIINKAESMRTLSEDNSEFKKELISITAV